jgi:tetratricopeptide (TPR) repeat protein
MELSFKKRTSSQERGLKRRGRRKTILLVLLFILLAGIITAGAFLLPGDLGRAGYSLVRIKNGLAFYLLGGEPRFYYLQAEMNGRDFRLTASDDFILTYRDEFVFKYVVSDDLQGKEIAVEMDGLTGGNILGKTLKGMDFVDRILPRLPNLQAGRLPTDLRIRVKYKDRYLTAIPVVIEVTAQDMLRYAQSSNNRRKRIDYLKKALAMNSKDVQVKKMLGEAYLQAGMLDEGLVQYREYLKMKPDDVAVAAALAQGYVQKGDYRQAVEAYNKLVRINPRDSAAFANLAAVYGRMEKWDKAVGHYRTALGLSPTLTSVRLKYAEALEKAQRFKEAVEQYRLVIKNEPSSKEARNALAELHLRGKNYDSAIEEYKEVIRLDPRNAAAYANLGVAYGAKGATAPGDGQLPEGPCPASQGPHYPLQPRRGPGQAG